MREEETREVSTSLSMSFPLGTLADSGGEAERPSSAFTNPVVLQDQGTGSSGLSRLQGVRWQMLGNTLLWGETMENCTQQ